MSIFDVLTNGNLGSVLTNLTNTAKNAATNIKNNTPGGLPGLAGAGALGALLGSVFQGDLMKNVALAGAGAVAWNFYKKWAAGQQGQGAGQAMPGYQPAQQPTSAPAGWGNISAQPQAIDPTAELVTRAMIYAARADGHIDATEQNRIDQILHNMLPGQDVSAAVQQIRTENIDPGKIAAAVRSPEQAQDVYRLSCAVIDIDHFMEHSYLDALAKSLNIDNAEKAQLEAEAEQAKNQLKASLPAA